MSDLSRDRKFLHDLASPIAIAHTLAKRLLPQTTDPKQAAMLGKVISALGRIEALHAEHRTYLTEMDPQESKKSA